MFWVKILVLSFFDYTFDLGNSFFWINLQMKENTKIEIKNLLLWVGESVQRELSKPKPDEKEDAVHLSFVTLKMDRQGARQGLNFQRTDCLAANVSAEIKLALETKEARSAADSSF